MRRPAVGESLREGVDESGRSPALIPLEISGGAQPQKFLMLFQ